MKPKYGIEPAEASVKNTGVEPAEANVKNTCGAKPGEATAVKEYLL